MACASGVKDREEEAAQYLLNYLCMNYNDAFVHVAFEAGLLLTNKEMDAASAAAKWEESNSLLRAQWIILWHLKAFFW